MEQGQGDHDRGNEQTHDAGTSHGILVAYTITARKIPGKHHPGSESDSSVRFQGSLPRAPPADRFSGLVLSDQESRHELPALPIIVDHRAGRANGAWLPALPVPGLRAAVQRADRHGAEPGPGADRHRVSDIYNVANYPLECCQLSARLGRNGPSNRNAPDVSGGRGIIAVKPARAPWLRGNCRWRR